MGANISSYETPKPTTDKTPPKPTTDETPPRPTVEHREEVIIRDVGITKTEKRVEKKLPHNYEIIIRDAGSPINYSSIDNLYEHLYSGVFLNQKRKKYWVEKNYGHNCFMLFARELSITWGEDWRHWQWLCVTEPTSDNELVQLAQVEVAELLSVCWLEVRGKFDVSNLSPKTMYEVVFMVMLKYPSYGWEVPINLRLELPNGKTQERKETLWDKPQAQWLELKVGEFESSPNEIGEMNFSLIEYDGGQWKRGLIIKGVVVRPKN